MAIIKQYHKDTCPLTFMNRSVTGIRKKSNPARKDGSLESWIPLQEK